MGVVGQQVHDRDGRRAAIRSSVLWSKTRAPRRRGSRRTPGPRPPPSPGCRCRPPRPEADRVAAELHHGHLHRHCGSGWTASRRPAPRPGRRGAGAGRAARPGRARRSARGARSSTSRKCLTIRVSPTPAPPRTASAWSISSSVTSSDGANRMAVGRDRVDDQARARARPRRRPSPAAATARPPAAAPGPAPTPRPAARPGPGQPGPARVARAGTSSASMTASTARAAAAARGWPPKVVPWSPGTKAAATSARAQQAPMGMPLPRALAMVTTSGRTPACWKPNHSPVRPRPVWTSSRISRTPRSSHSRRTPASHPSAHVDAALALHRLDQHGGEAGRWPPRGPRCRPGPRGGTLGQGLERLVLGGLAGGVEGGQRAPVEGAVGADHPVAAGPPTCGPA